MRGCAHAPSVYCFLPSVTSGSGMRGGSSVIGDGRGNCVAVVSEVNVRDDGDLSGFQSSGAVNIDLGSVIEGAASACDFGDGFAFTTRTSPGCRSVRRHQRFGTTLSFWC